MTSPPRIEQFLGGAWRADLRRIDDFRQRQPGGGVPVSRKRAGFRRSLLFHTWTGDYRRPSPPETSRIASKTKEGGAIGEFLRANAFERCAKRGKRGIGCAFAWSAFMK